MMATTSIGKYLDKAIPKDKIRVLWMSDTPDCATGFAGVARNLLRVLQATGKYDFTIIGVNHTDYYDREEFPYRIFEAMPALTQDPRHQDLFGRQRLLDFIGTGRFDLLFTLQDTFIIENIAKGIVETRNQMMALNAKEGKEIFKPFKWIFYYPIDGNPKSNWILDSALQSDYPVCYTEWGKQKSLDAIVDDVPAKDRDLIMAMHKSKIDVIYHGSDIEKFHKVEDKTKMEEFRHNFFQGKVDGKFLIVNVNRNQPRKDLAKTMAAFSKFLEKKPDSFLYLHCQPHDVGGDLREVSRNFKNLHIGENWSMPEKFSAQSGFPVEAINQIYNCADVVVSTTWGEGWGLSYTEAMAAKTLILVPDNTSAGEIVGKNNERGLLIKCGDSPGAFVCAQGDNEILRPLVNVDDMVEKLVWIYDNRGTPDLQKKIDAAYEWVKQYTWDGPNIGQRWIQIFEKAYSQILKDKWGTGKNSIGRNDQCPCGSGKKFKACHGA